MWFWYPLDKHIGFRYLCSPRQSVSVRQADTNAPGQRQAKFPANRPYQLLADVLRSSARDQRARVALQVAQRRVAGIRDAGGSSPS